MMPSHCPTGHHLNKFFTIEPFWLLVKTFFLYAGQGKWRCSYIWPLARSSRISMWSKQDIFLLTTFEKIMQNCNWEDGALGIFNSSNHLFKIHTFLLFGGFVSAEIMCKHLAPLYLFSLLSLFSIWYILLGVQISQDPLSSAVKFFKDTQFKSITKRAL